MVSYRSIVNHYEACLEEFGDNHRGVDWPNESDATVRYDVMLDLIDQYPNTLLDLGSGTGALLDRIRELNLEGITYSGLDLSAKFIALSREKYAQTDFFCRDILDEGMPGNYDYVVMNGVFTEKIDLSDAEMWEFFCAMIIEVSKGCNKGMAFNVMSKNVDWEREDLFHLSMDRLAAFLTNAVSREFVIRNDYGLYEYTTYVYFR